MLTLKQGIIVDPTIRFEVECHQSAEVHLEKKSIYEPTVNYFKLKYDLIQVEVKRTIYKKPCLTKCLVSLRLNSSLFRQSLMLADVSYGLNFRLIKYQFVYKKCRYKLKIGIIFHQMTCTYTLLSSSNKLKPPPKPKIVSVDFSGSVKILHIRLQSDV
ncbi:hypothetical protein ANN_15598 [Periplaneta americana]|uniref:Uncharacterized protein n=1 Tax=Periplaneta americana TaxID=6978 RepID=A0ABQ8SHI2_PERAM|nr:hypothetical protein ANN_15598 [Periplaneta americana]